MILLRKLGASLEEQIAGLLHDVSHTAFSHVIDFVFKDKDHSHDFHEKFHQKVIFQSEIPAILQKSGLEINRILDERNFPLLEKQLPDLCADRIDYTLRDMVAGEGFSDKISEYILGFIVHNNEIIIKNKLKERVTDGFADFSEELARHKKWIERGNFIKIVSF